MLLRDLQIQLQNYILGVPTNIQAHVREKNSTERLDIYRDTYLPRLIKILASDCPLLENIFGEDHFEVIAQNYFENYPPDHFDPRLLGKNLALFLKTFSPYKENPLLHEVAEFEFAVSEVVADESKTSSLKLHCNIPELWKAFVNQLPLPPLSNKSIPIYYEIKCKNSFVSFEKKGEISNEHHTHHRRKSRNWFRIFKTIFKK